MILPPNPARLRPPFDAVVAAIAQAYADPRPRRRVYGLAVGLLCGAKPKCLTSALRFLAQEQQDWSAQYRLFSQSACDPQAYFRPILQRALADSARTSQPVLLAQDDTLLRKTGRKIPGVRYARDPLSPPFHVNLVLGQRCVQASLLVRPGGSTHPWRALPVRFSQAPTPTCPRRATPAEQTAVREQRKKHRLCLVALEQLAQIRAEVDALGGQDRWLLDTVDGSYTNRTFLRGLPPRTDALGRVRKDAQLRAWLPFAQRHGRRKYGEPLPIPQAHLADETVPCQAVEVWVGGQWRTLRYKERQSLCWPTGTQDRPLRVLELKPLGYRLRQGSRLLYRQPAYLLTTDLTTPASELVADYLARWEIEVNFRDEKTILGVGQAQVRNGQAVALLPSFLVACYAALLWSSIQAFGDRRTEVFPGLPRWRRQPPVRPSTRDLIQQLERELQADRLGAATLANHQTPEAIVWITR